MLGKIIIPMFRLFPVGYQNIFSLSLNTTRLPYNEGILQNEPQNVKTFARIP